MAEAGVLIGLNVTIQLVKQFPPSASDRRVVNTVSLKLSKLRTEVN